MGFRSAARLRRLSSTLVWSVLSLTACGNEGDSTGGAHVIDERAGTYRGVGIKHTERDLRARFSPISVGRQLPLRPFAYSSDDLLAAPGMFPPRSLSTAERTRIKVARTEHASFLIAPGFGVYAVIITDRSARTSRGVGVGSDLGDIREVYRGATCGTQNENTEYEQWDYCTARIQPGRFIWFGDDPVRSVTLTIRPLVGPDPFT